MSGLEWETELEYNHILGALRREGLLGGNSLLEDLPAPSESKDLVARRLLSMLPEIVKLMNRQMIARFPGEGGAKDRDAVSESVVHAIRALGDAPGRDRSVAYQLGWSLARVAPPSMYADLSELARDPSTGDARFWLLGALRRMGGDRAVPVLLESLAATHDEPIPALEVLGSRRIEDPSLLHDAQEAIAPYLEDTRSEVRSSAKRALAKLAKGSKRRSTGVDAAEPRVLGEGLREVSTALTLDQLERLLRQTAQQHGGPYDAIARVIDEVREMDLNEERRWDVTLPAPAPEALIIQVHADDTDDYGVALWATEDVARWLDEAAEQITSDDEADD